MASGEKSRSITTPVCARPWPGPLSRPTRTITSWGALGPLGAGQGSARAGVAEKGEELVGKVKEMENHARTFLTISEPMANPEALVLIVIDFVITGKIRPGRLQTDRGTEDTDRQQHCLIVHD